MTGFALPQRALVTGALGFAGGHLLAELRAAGCDAWGIDSREAGGESRVAAGDVLDFEFVRSAIARIAPGVIFHLAALTSPRPDGPTDHRLFQVNVLGTRVLLEALLAAGLRPRVLVTSSSAVYGAPPAERQPIGEEAPLAPQNLYAASKCSQELVALTYFRAHGLPVVVTRAFNHTGPGERPQFALSGFARQLAAIETGEEPAVVHVGNLEAVRDYSDVRDVVRGYVAAALGGEPGECYNVCSGVGRSLRSLLDELRAACGRETRVELDPTRLQAADVPYQCGSYAKLAARTGWQPTIPIARTLADLLDHWRGAPAGGHQT